MDFQKQLSTLVGDRIGHELRPDMVKSSENDPFDLVEQQVVRPGWAVVLVMKDGCTALMLNPTDYAMLETGIIPAWGFVAQAHFAYGYWNGGSAMDHFWQALENDPGIQDPEKHIFRYLCNLKCKAQTAGDEKPTAGRCASCPLDGNTCALSAMTDKKVKKEEPQKEPDNRQKLFDALCKRVKDELGFDVISLGTHFGPANDVRIFPSAKPNKVAMELNGDLLYALLYEPAPQCVWPTVAKTMTFVAAKNDFEQRRLYSAPIPTGIEYPRGVCEQFWGPGIMEKWAPFGANKATASSPAQHVNHAHTSCSACVGRTCRKKWGVKLPGFIAGFVRR